MVQARSSNGQKRFIYQARDSQSVQKRATQSGLNYDTFFDGRFPKFTADTGTNVLRILPPTWENADHFGFDYYLHSNVGPDNSQYLCLERMADLAELHGVTGGKCPVCEERRQLERDNESEEATLLKTAHRVGCWVIDRNAERDGPKFWDMSWTMDKDIASLQINKRTGEALLIDDPDEGYDFEFVREGKGLSTRYIGKQIARRESLLSDDPKQAEAWLDFISEHPIPDVLNFFAYEHITKVFAGRKVQEEQPEPQPRATTRTRTVEREPGAQDAEPEQPATRQRARVSQPVEEVAEEPPARTRTRAKPEVEAVEEEEDVPVDKEADPVPSSMRERLSRMNERNTRK